MDRFGVIMAGGGGTRFWPLSRRDNPKQFLHLSGGDALVNEAIDRISSLVEKDHIFIVTNVTQAEKMREITAGRIPRENILAEPTARNTSACIGYAAVEILHRFGDGVMMVLPSDPYIRDREAFAKTLEKAAKAAEDTGALVTVGIKPTFPCTGYGYIRSDGESGTGIDILPVKEFVEKPNFETAVKYLEQGNYLWNSGMFFWKASVIMEHMERLLPDVHIHLENIHKALGTPESKAVLEAEYPVIPKISVDYGIMERAGRVYVLEGDFGWDDVGSWDTLGALHTSDEKGNISIGSSLMLDTENCVVYSSGRLVATLGVENLIIVETGDSIMICSRDRAQEVKSIVEELEKRDMREFL